MLLVALSTLCAAGTAAGVLVHAVRSAADGREDESGFHYTEALADTRHASPATPTHVTSAPLQRQ